MRRAHANRPRSRDLPLLGCFGPRSDSSTQVERGKRKPSRADGGSQVPHAATHGGYQRNRHRLVPASSEAKASLACEGRTLVGCARVSRWLQKSVSFAEAQRSASPVATGRVDGRLAPDGSQEAAGVKRRRSLASRRPSRNASEVRSRASERALRGDGPCSMEDTPDGCGNALRSRERDAGDLGGFHGGTCRASGVTPWGRRQGLSEARFARVTAGRQRPPGRLQKETTCDPPKRIGLNVMQAISSIARTRKRLTRREPTRRECSYEEREMAEVGPTHRASLELRSRKATQSQVALAKELSARTC